MKMPDTNKHAADMWEALQDAWKDFDENGTSSPDYRLDADNMERFAAALAAAYERERARTGAPAVVLVPATIREAIDDVKTAHGWGEAGWSEPMGDEPTTLTELADQWADQEANEDPQDRTSLEVWLLDRIDDGVIIPPEQ